MAGQHSAGRARPLGGAQQGTKVVGVGDPVEHDEEGTGPGRGCPAQDIEVGLGHGLGVGQHPLRHLGARLGIEARPADGTQAHAALGGQRAYLGEER